MSTQNSHSPSVTAWPHPAIYAALPVALGGLIVYLANRREDGGLTLTVINLVVSALCLIPVCKFCLFRITADSFGIRWRRWRGWKSAPWNEIADFYTIPSKNKYTIYHISTTSGIVEFNSRWARDEMLKDFVSQQATSSRIKQWEILGAREVDTDLREYRYSNIPKPELYVLGYMGLSMAYVLYYMARKLTRKFLDGAASMEVLPDLIPVALSIIIGSPVMYMLSNPIVDILRRRRKQERILITQAGIQYHTLATHLTIPWNEVMSIKAVEREGLQKFRNTYHIKCRNNLIEFTRHISNHAVLLQQIGKHTGQAKLGTDVWTKALDVEDGVSVRPDGDGLMVFNYQSPAMRRVLQGAAVIVLIITAVSVLRYAGILSSRNQQTLLSAVTLPAVLIAGLVLSCLWYKRAHVAVSGLGITKAGLLSRRFFGWDEITEYVTVADNQSFNLRIKTPKQKMDISMGICGGSELMKIIQARAIKASTKEWKPVR